MTCALLKPMCYLLKAYVIYYIDYFRFTGSGDYHKRFHSTTPLIIQKICSFKSLFCNTL